MTTHHLVWVLKFFGVILDKRDELSDEAEVVLGIGLIAVCCRWIWKIFMASYNTARAAKPRHVATRPHTVVTLYPGNRKLPKSTPNQYHICICNDKYVRYTCFYRAYRALWGKETPRIKITPTFLIISISSHTSSTHKRHSWQLISHILYTPTHYIGHLA